MEKDFKKIGRYRVFEKYCPIGTFQELGYSIKARKSEERVSVASKLELYTCKRLTNYLTLSGFFRP